ncbi:MAG: HNH endonuclease [Lachnospiraceae bacterium]|nr:HNH endonuclease [Lachnospiraceae bacterium]
MDNYKNPEWLYEQYITLNRTIKSIYTECGVSHHAIESNLKKFGIRKTPSSPKLPTKDELVDLHHNRGVGIYSIAKMYPGVGVGTVTKLMNQYGIDILSSNELHKKWWSKDKNKSEMSEIRRRLWKDDEYCVKTSAHLHDKEYIANRAKKLSAAFQGIGVNDWDGFITPERTRVRKSREYILWRESVFKRDNYTCQCCGARSSKHSPVFLHAHHLDGFANNPDLRFDVDNGITLCRDCHDIRVAGSFHNIYGTRNNTKGQYEEYLTKYRCELKERLHE